MTLFADDEAQELEVRYSPKTRKRAVSASTYMGEDDDQAVYEMMSAGYTTEQICAELGVSVGTYSRWKKKYPGFKAADEAGRAAAIAKWQRMGEENLDNKSFNSTIWDRCLSMRRSYLDTPEEKDESKTADSQVMQAMLDIITKRHQEAQQ